MAPTQALIEAAAEHTAEVARAEQYRSCRDQLAESGDDALLAWLAGRIVRHDAHAARAAEAQREAQAVHDAALAAVRGES